jgi:radical SAM protein with 4Fe4S-binding SPASM domain
VANVETNATLLSGALAHDLKKSGVGGLGISLDGSREETHGATRDAKSFQKVLEGITNANEAGIHVLVNVTVSKYNKNDLRNIIELLISYNVKFWVGRLALSCGKGQEHNKSQQLFLKDHFDIVREIYAVAKHYSDKISFLPMGDPYLCVYEYKDAKHKLLKKIFLGLMGGCSVLKGKAITINYDGSIRPCSNFPYTLPGVNIRKQSIVEIYKKNQILAALRNRNNLKGKCRVCKYQSLCGGCRAQIYAETGDFFEEVKNCPLFEPRKLFW